jgi:hypothetical protein
MRAVHGSHASTSCSTGRPTRSVISSAACASPYAESMPGKIAHHNPARSSLPTSPRVAAPITQYCTAGPSGVSSAGARKTRLKLGLESELPVYRAPICSRTTLPAPSQPSTYLARSR